MHSAPTSLQYALSLTYTLTLSHSGDPEGLPAWGPLGLGPQLSVFPPVRTWLLSLGQTSLHTAHALLDREG